MRMWRGLNMADYLEGRVVDANAISNFQKNEMFSLLTNNFEGYTKKNFEKDLENKDKVILLENSLKEIGGFTTIQNFDVLSKDQTIRGIFSGDTIINSRYWNKHNMFKVWLEYTFQKKEESQNPLYWFLISSGCRTYKILPAFFKDYFPKYDKEDATMKNVLDVFAEHKFGNEYDSKSGLIIFQKSTERLKCNLANVDEKQAKNPHVAYFLNKNPKFYLGHELACVVEIKKENLTNMGLKLLELK
jgi:hypothetical protein